MSDFLISIVDFFNKSVLIEQIRDVDVNGVFTNPWFLIPFICLIGWWVYKQAVNNLVLLVLVIGIWWFTGTPYAQDLILDGEIQAGKILPVAGVGIGALLVIIYLFFIRSD
ncbi:MAG: hypothetical protein H8E41_05290 [Desulfobulbaceae bacterium]|uniref:Uncharacterized protein n=1 Tax=Candidatus Desulfobia pelagia TaxID=2841692 RepID=A0A8J6NET2_9BACT|nr:hypothetical protein [Candidatus Desulfobia pelagia]